MYVIANLTSSNSSNDLHQTINWTNAYLLSFGQLETNFSEIWIYTHHKMVKEIILKIPSAKCLPFSQGFNLLLHEVGIKCDFREVALDQVSMTLDLPIELVIINSVPSYAYATRVHMSWQYIFYLQPPCYNCFRNIIKMWIWIVSEISNTIGLWHYC